MSKVISSFCSADEGQCVEVEAVNGLIRVTDSKDDSSVQDTLVFTREEWDVFIAGAKDGQFDYNRLNGRTQALSVGLSNGDGGMNGSQPIVKQPEPAILGHPKIPNIWV